MARTRASLSVGLEEILFLLRKNKVMLVRLLRHLSFKDALPSTGGMIQPATLAGDELLQPVGLAAELSQTSADMKPQQTKRVKLCYDFLTSIDQTGELVSAFSEDFFDEIKHQRNLVRRFLVPDRLNRDSLVSGAPSVGIRNFLRIPFSPSLFAAHRTNDAKHDRTRVSAVLPGTSVEFH